MKLVDYDFHLPPEQIAQHPAAERDRARLLVLDRADGSVRHLQFRDLVDFLRPPDLLVVNRTRVMAARLRGRRLETGGQVELLLIRREGDNWLAMGRPVRCEDPREHELEAEYCEVGEDSAARIGHCREAGGRVIAVGTTVVRTLETAAEATGSVEPWTGWSAKFICPPYTFKAVDALVTNFHLPRSSLLLLVAALVGRGMLMETYRQAVAEGYRFYSYGDAMLIV